MGIRVDINIRNTVLTAAAMKTTGLDVAQATEFYVAGMQTIGTTEEAVDLTDITAAGIGVFRVPAAQVNNIQLGLKPASTFFPFALLVPGEMPAAYPMENLNLFAKALVAPVDLEILANDA